MGSFGERLRREREMRGISLDEIATATKISARNLRALEEEKFKQLPGGIFNKGFVRAYAKFLGIDEEQMVAEYVTASQDTESAREQKLKNDLSKVEFKHDDEDQREISLEPKSQWGTIAVIVLIAALVFGGYEFYQKRKAEKQQRAQTPAPVAITPTPSVQATPVASTDVANANSSATAPDKTIAGGNGQSPNANPTDASKAAVPKQTDVADPKTAKTALPEKPIESQTSGSGPIDVKIHANQDSWISITADGKTIMKGTLPAASERAVRAKEQVVVVLGNVGGVEVSYNGKTLENLGKGQDVRKLTFTPTGYE